MLSALLFRVLILTQHTSGKPSSTLGGPDDRYSASPSLRLCRPILRYRPECERVVSELEGAVRLPHHRTGSRTGTHYRIRSGPRTGSGWPAHLYYPAPAVYLQGGHLSLPVRSSKRLR